MSIPDPNRLRPLDGQDRVVFLKPLVTDPRIEVGEYSYFDDPDDPTAFERDNVLYSYGPEKLIIGRYCAVAARARFVMAGANHFTGGVSAFPFTIFGGQWTQDTIDVFQDNPTKGDTVVGSDVWIGYDSRIMPGVAIGHGAIVAAGAVVASDVAPYTVVGGNPAKLIKHRFAPEEIELLLRAAWWDWPVELVTAHTREIMAGKPSDVAAVAAEHDLLSASANSTG